MNTKRIHLYLLALTMLLSTVLVIAPQPSHIQAQGGEIDAPELIPLVGGVDILAEIPGAMPNLGYMHPEGDCSNAATSYLAPGMEAEIKPSALPGQFIGAAELSNEDLYAYLGNLIDSLLPTAHTLMLEPAEVLGPTIESEDFPVIVLGDYACRSFEGGTAMFWQVIGKGAQLWLLESIRWENYDFSETFLPDELVINQIDNPDQEQEGIDTNVFAGELLMDNLSVRFLSPYIPPVSPADLGADTVAAIPVAEPACAYGAPSHVSVGDGYMSWINWGYSQVRADYEENVDYTLWEIGDEKFELDAYGIERFNYYVDNHAIESETDVFSADPYNLLPPIYIGEILDGPYCTTWNDVTDFTDTTYSVMIGTWWRVRNTEVGNNQAEGYLLESIVGYNDYDAYLGQTANGVPIDETFEKFDNIHTFYFMVKNVLNEAFGNAPGSDSGPNSAYPRYVGCSCDVEYEFSDLLVTSYTPPTSGPYAERQDQTVETCEGLLTSRLNDGAAAHPAVILNVRDEPGGTVVNRLATGFTFWVGGEPICQNGMRWWQVHNQPDADPLGWVAENDATSYWLIPGFAPQPTPTPTVEPTRIPTEAPPTPTLSPTRPPR